MVLVVEGAVQHNGVLLAYLGLPVATRARARCGDGASANYSGAPSRSRFPKIFDVVEVVGNVQSV